MVGSNSYFDVFELIWMKQSTFHAFNVYPDEDSEDEIDNTKELQIEEALKLYQAALKLHAQGPKYIQETFRAYKALFSSEVFRYPEALSEWSQDERYGTTVIYESDEEDDLTVDALTARGIGDSAPSTLPQIVYLSYKNHGQFMLDYIKHYVVIELAKAKNQGTPSPIPENYMHATALTALNYFAEALAKDESDSELWRKTARVASALGSHKVERFCLETVLDQDEEGVEGRHESLGLEEGFAGEDLKALLDTLSDDLSKVQPLNVGLGTRKLASFLQGFRDPYPFLPSSGPIAEELSLSKSASSPPKRYELTSAARTWAAFGKAILQSLLADQHGIIKIDAGSAISILLPGGDGESDKGSVLEASLSDVEDDANTQIQKEANAMKEVGSLVTKELSSRPKSPVAEKIKLDEDGQPKEKPPIVGAEDPKSSGTGTSRSNSPRKRSSSSAGLEEPADGGRIRSKRIRARESNADTGSTGEGADASEAQQFSEFLENMELADKGLFDCAQSLMSRFSINAIGSFEELTKARQSTEISVFDGNENEQILRGRQDIAVYDLRMLLESWENSKSVIALYSEGTDEITSSINGLSSSRNAGLTAFLEHSKAAGRKISAKPALSNEEDLAKFSRRINKGWVHIKSAALGWVDSLLRSSSEGIGTGIIEAGGNSSYLQYTWPESLKETVVQMCVALDDDIFSRLQDESDELVERLLIERLPSEKVHEKELAMVDMAETIFELHLDIYASITNPSSEVDEGTRLTQRDRVCRWSGLVSDLMNILAAIYDKSHILLLRYQWAMVLFAGFTEGVSREHKLMLTASIKAELEAAGSPTIVLQNNALMPEISVSAAERESSRLRTMDFFLGIFQADKGDPVKVIETLEIVLDRPKAHQFQSDITDDVESSKNGGREGVAQDCQQEEQSTPIEQMSRFLEKGSASLRLFLWQRLRSAYELIKYPTKVFSCYLRSIEIIMNELRSTSYLQGSAEQRQITLLKWLRSMEELVTKSLALALKEQTAFECIDQDHLVASMTAIGELARLIHGFTLFEDRVRVGQVKLGETPSRSSGNPLLLLTVRMRDMQIRTWTLMCLLLKEAMAQNKDLFPHPQEDLLELIRSVHHSTGLRAFCHASNKLFLQFAKQELCRFSVSDDWDTEMTQILYDLHGIKLSIDPWIIADHQCTPEAIDRDTAVQIVDFVLALVRRIPFRDLPKTELKSVIEKMQQAIGAPKESSASVYNQRIFKSFLDSSINPLDLYQSLKGLKELSSLTTTGLTAQFVGKGWYFLLGQMALSRFKSQKRVSQTPTDDLEIARHFFCLDLEWGMERWESWLRLAQTFDIMLEEKVSWSADALNTDRAEINALQRKIIHCYTMAVSMAVKFADESVETQLKMTEMYIDFGTRLYSSSRSPFDNLAFELHGYPRHFSGPEGMYLKEAHTELSDFKAWQLAAVLYQRALEDKPGGWYIHYMLGKCYWKMYNHRDNFGKRGEQLVPLSSVMNSIVASIRFVPIRTRQEPILEPHYKLVSVVHKCFQRGDFSLERAIAFLQKTPYAQRISPPPDNEMWEQYILSILKCLRTADKVNWHHRMISRVAHIIYDNAPDNPAATIAARNEFMQQIFTKTMVIQVWKPENERPGRHFVYTSYYVKFFASLLLKVNDKQNLEALAKRVRKRGADFFDYNSVWTFICQAYLKVIRRTGGVPGSHEEIIFKSINHETFELHAARLETWCHLPNTTHPILDVLREVNELKKLNSNLMRPTMGIDDLAADAYAKLYELVVPGLVEQMQGEHQREVMSLGNLLSTDGNSEVHPVVPSTSDTGPVRHRTKGVGRREVIKRAENAVTKPPPPPILPTQAPRVVPRPLISAAVVDLTSTPEGEKPEELQDSADDESELSDLGDEMEDDADEEQVKPVLFPGLISGSNTVASGD